MPLSPVQEAPASSRSISSASALTDIYHPEVNCVVWERDALFSGFNTPLPRLHLQRGVLSAVRPQEPLTAVSHALTQAAAPPQVAQALLADMEELVVLFALLTGATEIGLRFATLTAPMCPGFHVDRLSLRLVCTYIGPGTQWLENDAVQRSALGQHRPDIADADNPVILNPRAIAAMKPWAVGLLKGEN